ncbi:MAG: tetratricopeptide repeat protein, partial [Candidatus Rhabdochlamydia sp.]
LNGDIYTKKKLYIKAIDLNPKLQAPYYNLANFLEEDETVELLNGDIYTKKKLYIKAIDLDPTNQFSYFKLAMRIKEDETVGLLNGNTYTQKDLYIKVIDLDPTDQFSYFKLAMLIKEDETVELLNSGIYTKKELYIKAIDLDPKCCYFYHGLARFLRENERIQLLDGNIYTNRTLYIKIIDLDHQYKSAYYNLAALLNANERIQLLNGEVYTSKNLYLKVIDLDPEDGNSYHNLANLLEEDEIVEFLNGIEYTSKDLYIKAIDLDPQKESSYSNLAALLEKNETIELLNGEMYTSKDLYIKAIDLDPENGNSYHLLAKLLTEGEKIQFLNGNFCTQKELFLKSLDLSHCKIYENCKHLDLSTRRVYETHKSLKQIYIREIEQNPKNIESYLDLIMTIGNSPVSSMSTEEIKINQKNVSVEFLFKEALDLDPIQAFSSQFAPAFLSMASFLHDKTVGILNGIKNKCIIQDLASSEMLLKQGTSIILKNHQVLSTKALYDHALPLLSLAYLKRRGDQHIGNYLSDRKPIRLKDKVKFTKLMAYTYAYQKNKLPALLIKIGDALHPETRVLLDDKLYEKRTCYEEAGQRQYEHNSLFKQAESLYSHESLRKQKLFSIALESAYSNCKNHWEAYTTLAKILSEHTLQNVDSKYLLIFGECLKSYKNLNRKKVTGSIEKYYTSLDSQYKYDNLENVNIDDSFYFIKKQEFLLELLTYLPFCEEAYVALAASFQTPLIIHEKSYTSKESLYLKAIDLNPEYSLPYFLLGKEFFAKKNKTIQLLNGVTLSDKQLLMRAIQLGTYQAEAYHLAALSMHDQEGILLFDEKIILSRGDLFIRAFELDFRRVIDLKNFIYYVKRNPTTSMNSSS